MKGCILSPCLFILYAECHSVQSFSLVQLFVTPWTAAQQASLFITYSWSLLKLMSIELMVPHHEKCQVDESEARIKIAERNINNLRYVDDITLTAEGEEELRRILINMKEESEKAGLKFNVQKTEIMASSSITSWQMEGGKVGTVRFHFLGL